MLCSVLDLDAFERCNKAVNLGVLTAASGSEGLIANMQDHQFTCKLFRFLQLLCEGHNLGALPDLPCPNTYLPMLNTVLHTPIGFSFHSFTSLGE